MAAGRVTIPIRPSRRVNLAGTGGAAPSSTPSPARMARTMSASSCWFFGENGSMDGGMIQTLLAGIHDGT